MSYYKGLFQEASESDYFVQFSCEVEKINDDIWWPYDTLQTDFTLFNFMMTDAW